MDKLNWPTHYNTLDVISEVDAYTLLSTKILGTPACSYRHQEEVNIAIACPKPAHCSKCVISSTNGTDFLKQFKKATIEKLKDIDNV
jgi:hypothetical protein